MSFLFCCLACFSVSYAQMNVVGSAKKIVIDQYSLTTAESNRKGAVWNKERFDLSKTFDLSFQLTLSCGEKNKENGGIAFVFQQKNLTQIGGNKSGLGYSGINSPSLAIEFDNTATSKEMKKTSKFGHIAIVKNADPNHNSKNTLAGPKDITDINQKCTHTARIVWLPKSEKLKVYLDGDLHLSLEEDIVKTIFRKKPFVYWGFTASGGSQVHQIKVLNQPEQQELIAEINARMVRCAGESNGQAVVRASGGSGAGTYTYRWSDGSTQPLLRDAKAGRYSVTITDAMANSLVKNFKIGQPDSIKIPHAELTDNTQDDFFNWKAEAVGGTGEMTYTNGYAILDGKKQVQVCSYELKMQNKSGIDYLYEKDLNKIIQKIQTASASYPVATIGFVMATDSNGCSTKRYLPFATTYYPNNPDVSDLADLVRKPKKTPAQPEPIILPKNPKPKPLNLTPIVKNPALDTLKLTFNSRNMPDELGERRVRSGRKVNLDSNIITIKVWDEEYEDGDIISLYLNGNWILQNYLLKTEKKVLRIEVLPDADNFLVVYAHSEGKRPPNTAAMLIFDGNGEKKVVLKSSLHDCDAINLQFKGK
ncbi:MAG: lectin-like domain-containing protein [Chitinophagales bacterium]